MPNTVRTTISVPNGLKARMDAHPTPVNWSAIACRAFEAKLAESEPPTETVEAVDPIKITIEMANANDVIIRVVPPKGEAP